MRDLLRDSKKSAEARAKNIMDTTGSRVDGLLSAVHALSAVIVGLLLTMWMDMRAQWDKLKEALDSKASSLRVDLKALHQAKKSGWSR